MKFKLNNLFMTVTTLVIASIFSVNAVTAQEAGGEWSAGIRLGGATGLSLKNHSKSNRSAFEFIGGWNLDDKISGVPVTALYEVLAPVGGKRLSAILGGGPSFLFGDEFRFGLAGIIGFDWRVSNIINLQLDWQPTWYLTNGSDFSASNAGFTVRYVLNHKKVAGKK